MLRVPSILTGLSKTHDNGLRLSFLTNEMSLPEQMEAMTMHDKFGYLLFSPNPISVSDMPKEQAEDRNKSPSKRLRAVLYVLWQQTQPKDSDFEVFYRDRMEKLIDMIKAKLDNGEAE
jgi:hypothetical protein